MEMKIIQVAALCVLQGRQRGTRGMGMGMGIDPAPARGGRADPSAGTASVSLGPVLLQGSIQALCPGRARCSLSHSPPLLLPNPDEKGCFFPKYYQLHRLFLFGTGRKTLEVP